MAEDNRRPNLTTSDASTEAIRPLPRDPNQPIHKKPRVFIHRPNEDPEEENTARKNLSVLEAAKTIDLDDFSKVHQTPCFRDAVMPAIGVGSGVGALRFVVGGSINKALNFAMGSFMVMSIGTYQYCQRQRRREKEGIRKAVQVLDEKQALTQKGLSPENVRSNTLEGERNKPVNFWSTFKFW